MIGMGDASMVWMIRLVTSTLPPGVSNWRIIADAPTRVAWWMPSAR